MILFWKVNFLGSPYIFIFKLIISDILTKIWIIYWPHETQSDQSFIQQQPKFHNRHTKNSTFPPSRFSRKAPQFRFRAENAAAETSMKPDTPLKCQCNVNNMHTKHILIDNTIINETRHCVTFAPYNSTPTPDFVQFFVFAAFLLRVCLCALFLWCLQDVCVLWKTIRYLIWRNCIKDGRYTRWFLVFLRF